LYDQVQLNAHKYGLFVTDNIDVSELLRPGITA